MLRRDIFQALADPTRRKIIEELAESPMTVNDVAEKFSVSRPAISKHLKVLEECGVVNLEKKGRKRYCFLRPSSLLPAFVWMEQYRDLWEARIDRFEAYLNQIKPEIKPEVKPKAKPEAKPETEPDINSETEP